MAMDKIANLNLETTADYQSLSGLNVQFWNQDKGTAVLQFNITRNNYPLGLSEENVKVFIALESGDSFLVDDNLDYLDELNGVVSYTIPDDFMRVASKVTGQIYVTTLDEEEVVVQRQFTFNVANDLIADLPAEDKIREIKYFSDMRVEVAQMMEKLNNDFANMNDYVTQVEQTTQDGITSLTNLIDSKQDAYNANHTVKMQEINDKGTEYSTKFDEDKAYIDEAQAKFVESVNGSEVVTTGQSENWQKYKLTEDDGTYKLINLNNDLSTLQALTPGYYYTTNTPGIEASSTAGYTHVEHRDSNLKRITFRPYNSNQEFVMIYFNEWNDWENKFDGLEKSIDAQSKANVAENNAKVYADSKVGELHKILFNGTVNNVGSEVNLLESLYDYNMIVVSGKTPGGVFNEVVLPAAIKTDIMIQKLNLSDSDGTFLGIYELKLEVTNGSTLTIINDMSWDNANQSASGPNRNAFTIQRIEGWK